MGTSHKSGDLDVQMPPTEVSTEQAAQTGTADKSSDQESQNGNVCNKSLEEQKSHANVCSASTTDIESTPESWKSDIDKGTSGHESGEKVLESCFPGGPRQRGPKHNPAEPNSLSRESKDKKCLREEVTDSWTSTKAKSGWSQETNAASLEEEKSESHVTDKDMGADICDGDKELQKCSIEKGGTDTLRTRPQTWSGAKPKSPTSTDELDSPASNSSKKNKAPRYLLMGCLIALALASVPSIISWMQRPPVHHDNVVERFLREFASVKRDFPGQYDGLWFRSEKLLQKHVNTSDPSAPSILILTAARDGERTLRCVSERIAKSYAIAHNASWFLVSGPSKSKYDSATSKMQIDNELSSGFQVGNSRAAVLYRLETLPAGSLLILYKYCDHENAAFKKVALVLPILLDEQSLETDLSFPEVEEKVKDLLWERFANSDVIAHNEMDVDKLSGVWSRISHVVLPVLPVDYVESGQCPGTKD
ncbi:hypothetical protein GDO81_017736 [Engystomops pustulosus]|uniref:Torsin-1A-interacting protein 1/2 AAA+ activator domain-containing protein n=1 Tax=Engystomops pustulosus TaxID=76066 RepID=A0AAV7A6W2_ENGPU|nr:hypothetical protein GDO81_017736 [Engystomops pustulosus]